MIYSTMLGKFYRALYGDVTELPADAATTGLVLVADGVGGLDLCANGLRYAMARDGLTHRFRVASWGHGLGRWHEDLTNVANHDTQAGAMAAEVEQFRAEHPAAPVFLVGKSGGTGVVAKVLERLPEGAVEAAVLLAPALSPSYDLSRALKAVRREMVVFWSPLDVFVLGAGTQIFGTVDRVNSVSAGLVGFRTPEGADPDQYRKLRQVRWSAEMVPTGYLGGHVGPDSPAFLRKYVVPILRADLPAPADPASEQPREV